LGPLRHNKVITRIDLTASNEADKLEEQTMKSAIRKMGNSHGVIIPKPILAEMGAKAGDQVDVVLKAGKIVIAPMDRDPRAAWAEECKALVEAGEDGLVWPEFANEDDKNFVW
jgi:antitoxin MazE